MNVVFFQYDLNQQKKYWHDESVVFFDDKGWWVIKDGKRQLQSLEEIAGKELTIKNNNFIDDINKLRLWGPIWSRWSGKGDQQELRLRAVYFIILRIVEGLKKMNISCCVMHTGVSHHIDSLAFETACNIAGVPMLFLYSEVLSNRLIPMLQIGEIRERRPLGTIISNYTYESIIKKFIANKKNELPPENNIKINGINAKWQIAIIIIFWLDLKKILRSIFKKSNNNKSIFGFLNSFYPLQYTTQALQQLRAINYLNSRVKKPDYFIEKYKITGKPKILIAAHYQPEATSFPEGGKWGNHVDIAIELKRKGYKDILIYKEHPASALYLDRGNPTQVGMNRSPEYYEQLEKLGCEFLETNYKTSIDRGKCCWYLPITITGTIAIERSLAGLHTLVTGDPWYKGMPGVLQMDKISSFDNIPEEWITHNEELAKKANEFLLLILNCKTIENVPGIGTGKMINSPAAIAAYEAEFFAVLDRLKEYTKNDDILKLNNQN